MSSEFRDPADSSRASHWPDIASEVDRPEDVLAELLDRAARRWKGDLPRTMAEFRAVVTGIAIEAIKDAAGDPEALRDLFGNTEPKLSDLETTKKIVWEIVRDNNPHLQAECVDFVFGFGALNVRTETEIAEDHGLERATVSQRCVALRELFRLPEVHGMKSDEARESYSRRQMGKRQRPPREPWPWAGVLKGALCGV